MRPGKFIMGLDNASPFFDFAVTWYRILHSSNFFEYGGIFYTLPFTALRLLSVPGWLISQLFTWGALLVGMLLYYQLFNIGALPKRLQVLAPIILLSNLIPVWIFGQPIYLFVASFAGIPAALLLISSDRRTIKSTVILLLGMLYFLSTSINPIAFCLYILQAAILAVLLVKTPVRIAAQRAAGILFLWLLIAQVLLIIGGKNQFIGTELVSYLKTNITSPLAQEVTDSLRLAELKNNSILNVARFATGWLELNDLDNKDLFIYSRLYAKNILFIVLGLVPFASIMYVYLRNKDWRNDNNTIIIAYLATILITSTYALLIIGYVPLLRDGLRWISSKTWPMLFILGNYLLFSVLSNYKAKNTTLLLIGGSLLFGIYAFPWLSGNVVNRYSYVSLPEEYLNFPRISNTDTLAVYPMPQKLFFRMYDWGYYGTDFLSYITPAKIVDGTSISRGVDEYASIVRKPRYFIAEDFTFVPSNCQEKIVETTRKFKLSFCEPVIQ